MSTNVEQFLSDLDGGVFSEKLSAVLSNVAAAVIDQQDNRKKGKIVIELELVQIAQSYQVNVTHSLKFVRPTGRGEQAEKYKTSTPMYVGAGGAMTFFPEKQGQMFDKEGGVAQGDQQFPVK